MALAYDLKVTLCMCEFGVEPVICAAGQATVCTTQAGSRESSRLSVTALPKQSASLV